MFGFVTNQQQINKLEARLDNANGLIHRLENEIEQLQNVLVKSGIIEDTDMSDVMYRSVRDPWSLTGTHRIPFIVNQAKVK